MSYFRIEIIFPDKTKKKFLFIQESFSLADFLWKFFPAGTKAKNLVELTEKSFERMLNSKKYQLLNDFENEKI
jgi:hypothetical protein